MTASPLDNAHVLDESREPAWQRGHMAARIAIRDCENPTALGHLRGYAESQLARATRESAEAHSRLLYARGFQARMTALDLIPGPEENAS